MGVHLRGLQTRVAEKLLHDAKVGAAVEQVGGKAVTKGVGMRRRPAPAVDDAADIAWAEATSSPVQEQGVGRASRRRHGAAAPGPSNRATASAAGGLIGTWRCLDPLPQTVTRRRRRSRSPGRRPHSSATRRPAAVQQLQHGVVAEAHGWGIVIHPSGWHIKQDLEL